MKTVGSISLQKQAYLLHMKNLGLLYYFFRHREKYSETEGSDKWNGTI